MNYNQRRKVSNMPFVRLIVIFQHLSNQLVINNVCSLCQTAHQLITVNFKHTKSKNLQNKQQTASKAYNAFQKKFPRWEWSLEGVHNVIKKSWVLLIDLVLWNQNMWEFTRGWCKRQAPTEKFCYKTQLIQELNLTFSGTYCILAINWRYLWTSSTTSWNDVTWERNLSASLSACTNKSKQNSDIVIYSVCQKYIRINVPLAKRKKKNQPLIRLLIQRISRLIAAMFPTTHLLLICSQMIKTHQNN